MGSEDKYEERDQLEQDFLRVQNALDKFDVEHPEIGLEVSVNDFEAEEVYKRCLIHVYRLLRGVYAAVVVRIRASGSRLENVRGEYRTRDEAVVAAKAQIDQEPADRSA